MAYIVPRRLARVADPVALNLGILLAILVAGVSAMLLLVSVLSWLRLRSLKLLFAGGAFAVLILKGALAAWRAYDTRDIDLTPIVLDAFVLGFLYAAVAKR